MPSELFVPPPADALIRGGHKIQAIKAVIDANPGASLRAAKDAVEAYERRLLPGESAAAHDQERRQPDTGGLPEAARQALMAGDRIAAIKIVRAAYGLDLRSALQRVDDHARGRPRATAGGGLAKGRAKPPGGDSVRGGDDNVRIVLIAFAIAVVVVAVGYWVL
ncbi:hypothetical protein [Lysobacter enzymogenes]|uniref:hypothetical protein n=1 Tax=Lysobacter enzymogenes TaxID=69 RepID=UPI001A961E89|nr:hypothetical protein [Lysobacter enzymogenes]QQP95774.1 hypothetical protein JHW38_21510 [Lysobacter enzymogenes]